MSAASTIGGASHASKVAEIHRLRDVNAILLAALEKIANGEGAYGAQAFEYKQIARAAIAATKRAPT